MNFYSVPDKNRIFLRSSLKKNSIEPSKDAVENNLIEQIKGLHIAIKTSYSEPNKDAVENNLIDQTKGVHIAIKTSYSSVTNLIKETKNITDLSSESISRAKNQKSNTDAVKQNDELLPDDTFPLTSSQLSSVSPPLTGEKVASPINKIKGENVEMFSELIESDGNYVNNIQSKISNRLLTETSIPTSSDKVSIHLIDNTLPIENDKNDQNILSKNISSEITMPLVSTTYTTEKVFSNANIMKTQSVGLPSKILKKQRQNRKSQNIFQSANNRNVRTARIPNYKSGRIRHSLSHNSIQHSDTNKRYNQEKYEFCKDLNEKNNTRQQNSHNLKTNSKSQQNAQLFQINKMKFQNRIFNHNLNKFKHQKSTKKSIKCTENTNDFTNFNVLLKNTEKLKDTNVGTSVIKGFPTISLQKVPPKNDINTGVKYTIEKLCEHCGVGELKFVSDKTTSTTPLPK